MRRLGRSSALAALLLTGAAAQAQSPRDQGLQPDAAYLDGTWAVGAAAACADPGGERLTFAADGTVVTRHGGRVMAAGYWRLSETHRLDLHLLAAPDAHEILLGQDLAADTPLHIMALTFDVEPGAFRLVAVLGRTMQGADLARCP